MFTGIVSDQGKLVEVEEQGGDCRLVIKTNEAFLEGCAQGDSIMVSGVCLTAREIDRFEFSADVSVETTACTTLGSLLPGSSVNLERAMLASSRFDGHLVSGHVDAVAELFTRVKDGRAVRLTFNAPAALMKYIAVKGSVCLDGVSLTVNEVSDTTFSVCVIPHTLQVTTLGQLQTGAPVNMEVDMVARYLERLLASKDSK